MNPVGRSQNFSENRPGNVFAAAEVGDIPQIHAAWSSSRVYGISTSQVPVLTGLLTDSTGLGRRGVWWTYRFFADTEGRRIKCENTPSGSQNLVGVMYRDSIKQVIRGIIGLRDTKSKQQNCHIVINNLSATPYISSAGKVRVRMWYNYQTQFNVSHYGVDSLPKIIDEEYQIINNKIDIVTSIDQWDAVLIELSKPLEEVYSILSSSNPDFVATKTLDKKVNLKWTLNQQVDNGYFIVEKAINNNLFKPIAKIYLNSQKTNYQHSLQDSLVEDGINYYRYKFYDESGDLKFTSNVKTVHIDYFSFKEVKVFPNPSNSEINIFIEDNIEPQAEVALYNLSGKLIHKENIELNTSKTVYRLNIPERPQSGLYLINIKFKNSEYSLKHYIK